MKFLARHITVDMYNCKHNGFADVQTMQSLLKAAIEKAGLIWTNSFEKTYDDGRFSCFLIMDEGHIVLHAFPLLRYVAVDVYTCSQFAQPEKLTLYLRYQLKPEKAKTTFLKRGDFGTVKDMKPKTKTKVAPLRRIRNTGAKMLRMLSGRGKHAQ